MTTTTNQARTTPLQLAFLLAPLLIALILIVSGLYFWGNPIPEITQDNALLLTLSGLLILSLSTYWLIQTRKRMLKILTAEPPKMTTTLQCGKCGIKNVRDFQRGDYIYKQTDEPCPNDKEKMTISAIFHEIKDKPKETYYV